MELPKVYTAADHESTIFKRWTDSGKTNPDNLPSDEPYTIALPPPNVTGTLHLGHAVMLAIEDIMIRYQRMQGKKALWVPGTDHAGIATQTKVEKLLMQDRGLGNPRAELGREPFLAEVKKFAAASHDTIVNQAKAMGTSLDWSREAYTFDKTRNRAVNLVFKEMFADGLIYRGHRIVNWCPRCQSTLADDEVEYKAEATKFYYFKYGPVIIGTARPETKFLDKTIVVHPDDQRYQHLHGKEFEIEWIDGKVMANVIADPTAQMDFGSGAMTITPAHSQEDFFLAQKYHLPIVQIINEAGNFTEAAGAFAGKSAAASRSAIVQILADKGLVDHIEENYQHNLSVCYRCGTAIQPLTKVQWFINVNKHLAFRQSRRHPIKGLTDGQQVTLKQLMRHVVETEQVTIVPDRFNKVYYQWIDNLRDWNISRQIWFGHRVPVWYDAADHTRFVSVETKAEAQKLLLTDAVEQDPDTLDTWFSSGLWTWSSLLNADPGVAGRPDLTVHDWVEHSPAVLRYHPTSVLETGYDILFFWVARMILMTTYALGEIPFRTVYLHGLVRDEKGRKMSKSLNNIIDPLDMINQYGTDALRLALVVGTTPGNDSKLSAVKIASYRNFVNKIWNVSRYVLMSAEGETPRDHTPTLADLWIKSRLALAVEQVTSQIEAYQYSLAAERAYDFLWHEFADWYVEIAKLKPNPTLTRHILETTLKLLHPFVPFVTEVIWEKLHPEQLLMTEAWPLAHGSDRTVAIEEQFGAIQDIITQIRNLRAQYKIPYTKIFAVYYEQVLTPFAQSVIQKFCRVEFVQGKADSHSTEVINLAFHFTIRLGDLIDVAAEKARLQKELTRLQQFNDRQVQKLSNSDFTNRAPIEIVDKEKAQLAQLQTELDTVKKALQRLQ